MKRVYKMPFGAAPTDGGTLFRLWAPKARAVEVVLGEPAAAHTVPLLPVGDGWFERGVPETGAGTRYRFRIDGGTAVPDPASRFQPDDVHGASEVIDPRAFAWTDDNWRGRPWEEAVFYELHVGAFSPEGTYTGVARRLDHLRDLGVTAIELMPLADSPGARNWGYDGAYPFAPESSYGRPEELKALIQAAHEQGLMVFLDVVYNHFGPEGNYLGLSAPPFFTDRHRTPWGSAINYDGDGSRTVRDFFIANALYWIEEYHFDGLRLDAVHAVFDDSSPDILTELADTVHAAVGDARHVHLVLENDHNAARYLEPRSDRRSRRYAAQWNDDIHHALHVLITGETGGYYEDYAETPIKHLGRALTEGFAYQGEASPHRDGRPRGERSDHLPITAFVSFLQNHDQVGNRAFGERITADAPTAAVRAALAVMLLAPSPPLLFMGEEWGATQPFPFFCDFGPDLADAVRDGRRREFARFPEFRDEAARARIPDPNAETTFRAAILDWAEREREPHRSWLAFYSELLRLRHRAIVPKLARIEGGNARFEKIGTRALVVRWRLGDGTRLTLFANMDNDAVGPLAEIPKSTPLCAVGEDAATALAEGRLPPWSVVWFLDHATTEAHR